MWNVLTQFRTKRSFISELDDDVYNIDETKNIKYFVRPVKYQES